MIGPFLEGFAFAFIFAGIGALLTIAIMLLTGRL